MELRPPFERVLIANRGEIAVRVARTCRAMNVATVAVYSDADADSPHVRACDQAIRIGPAPAAQSYLNVDAILEAAASSGAQAIHPGYGFLSESAGFAKACADAGVVFVGPPHTAIRAMGDKIAAKRTVEAAGVPTVPGYHGGDQAVAALTEAAKRIGLPVLVKAAAGGGGKGMRLVTSGAQFADAIAGAKREAAAAFGDDTVFLERYLKKPRHIEFQVLADAHGNCIHLGERECSIQRRHQKVLEETPSTALTTALRAEMGAAAIRAARAVGYVNAGTVEFMLEADGRYYFLEMNTRLQVEHPITELVTGFDLVRAQLLVAAGRTLQLRQEDVSPRGHAIEVRVYAEDAENGFLPSVGRITHFALPEGPGIRNDAGVETGSAVTVDYDPMLAKLAVNDRTRETAIDRLRAALEEYVVGGVTTNIPFQKWLASNDAFAAGATYTTFIDDHFRPELLQKRDDARVLFAAAAAWVELGAKTDSAAIDARYPGGGGGGDPWRRLGAWRHSVERREVSFSESEYLIAVEHTGAGAWRCSSAGSDAMVKFRDNGVSEVRDANGTERFIAWARPGAVAVNFSGRVRELHIAGPPSVERATHSVTHDGRGNAGRVQAPMTGTIVKAEVKKGERVRAHQVLAVLEAMKMEHAVAAPYDGTITALHARVGKSVSAGEVLAEIEPE